MPEITLRSVRDALATGKRVLVRVDFNVPLNDGKIVDDARIKAAVPTIRLLLEKGAAKILLLTHFGRPTGIDEQYRTAPLLDRLRQYVDSPAVEIHENLRFDPREEAGDPSLAAELAQLGDLYVNEAFSNSHRTHASMVELPKLLPSCAGLELIREVSHLAPALTPPANSLALIGGAKFETKQPLLEKLLKEYPKILLGGALANDLLKARGLPVGESLVSAAPVPEDLAGDERVEMPGDVRVAGGELGERNTYTADVHADEHIVDLGEETSAHWGAAVAAAELVLWNGPLGIYEQGEVTGTDALAQALVQSSAKAIIGGGDTAAALAKFTFDPERIFISTGGGAMLDFLAEDGRLPALEVLRSN